jgi:asparagine synthase (glutamine-hydrolysing)
MCGICGFIRFDRAVDEGDGRIIRQMNHKIIHRGPDAQDTLLFDNVALGFSRLSIIGLANGMQPILNEDRSIVLVCNGEIFNYIELKDQLRKRGHIFRTDSDVEVIVHLYEEQGMDFLNTLNGQFAFALYDLTRKTLFCARDQMGIVPFFYCRVGDTFIFGSEIKAILEHPQAPLEPDLTGLDQVFTFAGLISPRTMFRGIRSLENGHFLRVDDNGEITDKEYWDLIYPEGEMKLNGKKEEQYIDELEELFEHSIRLRLRSDVPTGLYLSGGLDSSMIAMKVSQLLPGAEREAFSIDFIDSQYSESIYQKLIARESGSRLHQKKFFYDDITERLRHSIYHCECPVKETYNTASLSLSESVRAKGIKVIQAGEGADELFAGYVGYRFDAMKKLSGMQDEASAAEKALRNRLWGDPLFFYERNFLDYEKTKRALYSADLNASFEEINCLNHFVVDTSRLDNRDVLNKRAYADYKIRLVDHLVADHGDRMALANAVEARYPFLDKDLVQYSTRLPSELKLKDLNEKYILRQLARRFVPRTVAEREKFHFVAPGSPFLIRKDKEYINDLLSYDRIKRQGYFNPDRIESLKKTYREDGFVINAPYENDLLITVMTFGVLMDVFFDG